MKPAYLFAPIMLILAMLACNLPGEEITPEPGSDGSITGVVWHDLCALPDGPLPNPIPAGCVPSGGGGAVANGTLDAGEPGIAGLTVELHSASCADPVIASAITDAVGLYAFNGLSAGSYCISVQAGTELNSLILIPGGWTSPVSTGSPAQLNVTLQENSTLANQNFGWDYQFLPPYTGAEATPAVPPTSGPTADSGAHFIVDMNANCRTGPGTVYSVVTSFTAGATLTLVGRNDASSWWYAQADSTTKCWISGATGHTTGNTSALPVVAAPPTPVPTNTSPAPAGDLTPPTLTDPVAIYTDLYYSTTNCGSNELQVAIRASDSGSGLDAVWLNYRYLGDGGYVGSWHTVSPNDNAMGGRYGFTYTIGPEAALELGTDDGSIQYQFFARDRAGNTAYYPDGYVLGISLWYCP